MRDMDPAPDITLEPDAVELLQTYSTMKDDFEKEAYEENRKKLEDCRRNNTHEHKSIGDVLHMLRTIGIAFLVGPTGTGKSTLAKTACKHLFNLTDDPVTSGKYAQISFSPDTTSGEMIGRTDVNGNFHESEIVYFVMVVSFSLMKLMMLTLQCLSKSTLLWQMGILQHQMEWS